MGPLLSLHPLWGLGVTSDLRLDQVVAFVFEEGADVDGVVRPHLLQHAVQDDVGAGAPHPGAVDTDSQPRPHMPTPKGAVLPAVHQHGADGVRPGPRGPADEAEERQRRVGNTRVGPLRVLVPGQRPLGAPPLLTALRGEADRKRC